MAGTAAAAATASIAARGATTETVVVKTSKGQLRGAREQDYVVFKGVQYAGPSEGANRFKGPTKLEPWTGVRDALEYGRMAMQNRDPQAPPDSILGPQTENCQFLNIWTPSVSDGKKRAVMFYSHGGGFATGSGGWERSQSHDGSALSKNDDVVVITTNHRLGLFGYLYLGDILGEEYAASGNAGMLDIVQALDWVHDNIAQFGGDPGNVMIYGESGGGAKTSTLLAMPSAHGLFHKASIESGPGIKMQPRETATATTKELLAFLGLSTSQARELLNVPAAKLLEFQQKNVSAGRGTVGAFAPVVEGHYLPAHPFDPVAPAISRNIPIIVGTNTDESIAQMRSHPLPEVEKLFNMTEETLRERVRTALGANADQADQVIEVVRRNRPKASPTDLYVAITTGMGTWYNSILLAERKVQQHGAPVFMYRFAYESEVPVAPNVNYPLKAAHGMEIVFKFDHPEMGRNAGNKPERFQAAKNMSRSWAAFAKTSNPSVEGLPPWPAYTLNERATMILNTQCSVEKDPFAEERKLWEKIAKS